MSILKLGLSGLTPSDLVTRCRNLENSINGNASFPTPDPTIADLTAQRELLSEWISKSADGSRTAIATRNAQYTTLLNMLKKLARYVSMVADGDEAIILSSGFDVRRTPEPVERLSRPVKFIAERDKISGVVDLKWDRVANAYSNIVEITTDDPREGAVKWTQVAITTRSRYTVENLSIGTFYWFRVRAIGASGLKSPWSDVALVMAA
ncbi:MAG: fibronectin type III domain-containing protein [Cryomorphaceae bacterium]